MKLFVAKLNREVTDENLKELFSQYGEVEFARVITDRDTGQSKCFGFVTMSDPEAGRAAMSALNGQEFMRFRMVVKEAEERERPAGGGQRGGGRGGDSRDRRPATGASSGGERRSTGLQSSRAQDSNEFSRVPDSGGGAPKGGGARRFKPDARRKERDIYQDGPPKTPKTRKPKSKNQDWFDDMDFD